MKTVTREFLTSHKACKSAMKWVTENKLIGLHEIDFIKKLMESEKYSWANWLIVRLMNKTQKVQYAIFAAEQVIDIYEKKYPDDLRPRKAIEAAKSYLDNPCKKTKAYAAAYVDDAAAAAAAAAAADDDDAYAAAAAAYAAAAAADAAAAAYVDADDDAAAAYVDADDDAAAYVVDAAAAAAAYAAYAAAARITMQITILNYGITLIQNT